MYSNIFVYCRFAHCPIDRCPKQITKLLEYFPNLNKLHLDGARLKLSESTKDFWRQLKNLKKLDISFNNLPYTHYNDFFTAIGRLQKIQIHEELNAFSAGVQQEIVRKIYSSLQENQSLLFFKFFCDLPEVDDEIYGKMQKVVNEHPCLIFLSLGNRLIFSKKNKQRLNEIFLRKLQTRYDETCELKEVQVFIMGDGRSGKTSLVRNLCGKMFRIENPSTVVLEDTNIFQVQEFEKELKPITKYDLSVKRVEEALYTTYKDEDKPPQTSYTLPFEKELVSRTLRDDEFIKNFAIEESKFAGGESFIRIYDFGGQEIFSSVHQIFMNPNALYLVVFNLLKITETNLQRIVFWCESILKHTPSAPVMLIGTHYSKFYKKKGGEGMENINTRLKSLVLRLSKQLNLLARDENQIFFPIENSQKESHLATPIYTRLHQVANGQLEVDSSLEILFSVPTVWILFLDNCREERSYMTLERFNKKARECGFSEIDGKEMLEIYTTRGIVIFFHDDRLSAAENLIFFAPSFIAQAVGKFIRDPSFHQLAYRVNKDVFSDYKRYIDSGKITEALFKVLMKEYTQKEQEYVLNLALKHLILVRFEIEENCFLVPELLSDLKNSKIQPAKNIDLIILFSEVLRLATFVQVINVFLQEVNVLEPFIYKGFARFILDSETIIDVLVISSKEIGFAAVQGGDLDWLKKVVDGIARELGGEMKIKG
eukprot:snap_masked-scaffold_9-processed-gene-7.48-mRNA-1 protein AED:1.00 eAED:1.00 QI:0/0/0/0/1/1/6/0/710